MEVDATLFIPVIILAITQLVKMGFPQINGWLTILVAFIVGIVVALIDQFIGVSDITIAQGLLYALAAIGISVAAGKAGGGVAGDESSHVTRR